MLLLQNYVVCLLGREFQITEKVNCLIYFNSECHPEFSPAMNFLRNDFSVRYICAAATPDVRKQLEKGTSK